MWHSVRGRVAVAVLVVVLAEVAKTALATIQLTAVVTAAARVGLDTTMKSLSITTQKLTQFKRLKSSDLSGMQGLAAQSASSGAQDAHSHQLTQETFKE
jgi:hypothetical protein